MHGGAITLAQAWEQIDGIPDLIIASDMLDLSTFLALTRKKTANIPTVCYFHENQLAYPWSPSDPDPLIGRDLHYGFINFSSACCADYVLFNSNYHKQQFLQDTQQLIKSMPDNIPYTAWEQLQKKSQVLPLGLDLQQLMQQSRKALSKLPLILLWNHRWEYDKDPDTFFSVCRALKDKHIPFQLILLGESYREIPSVFKQAYTDFSSEIIHSGYVADRKSYEKWLHSATVIPVTSRQDFFGISTAEAIAAGCYPFVPDRLAFPELIPDSCHPACLYYSVEELIDRLAQFPPFDYQQIMETLQKHLGLFDWTVMASHYDALFEEWGC